VILSTIIIVLADEHTKDNHFVTFSSGQNQCQYKSDGPPRFYSYNKLKSIFLAISVVLGSCANLLLFVRRTYCVLYFLKLVSFYFSAL